MNLLSYTSIFCKCSKNSIFEGKNFPELRVPSQQLTLSSVPCLHPWNATPAEIMNGRNLKEISHKVRQGVGVIFKYSVCFARSLRPILQWVNVNSPSDFLSCFGSCSFYDGTFFALTWSFRGFQKFCNFLNTFSVFNSRTCSFIGCKVYFHSI